MLSHSDPKATNPGWLVVFVAPGRFPGIRLNRILRSPNIFLWQTRHFLVIPPQQNTRKNILHNLYLIYFSRGRRVQNNLNWFSCSEFAKNAWTSCCNWKQSSDSQSPSSVCQNRANHFLAPEPQFESLFSHIKGEYVVRQLATIFFLIGVHICCADGISTSWIYKSALIFNGQGSFP